MYVTAYNKIFVLFITACIYNTFNAKAYYIYILELTHVFITSLISETRKKEESSDLGFKLYNNY